MSEGHAHATVRGNLGRDPETRQAGSSTVTKFAIGVGIRRKQADGSYGFDTNWYEASVWGARGQGLAKFLKKGGDVIASGDQFVRTYQKRDGTTGFAIELSNATVTPGPRADVGAPQPRQAATDTTGDDSGDDVGNGAGLEGDIPF